MTANIIQAHNVLDSLYILTHLILAETEYGTLSGFGISELIYKTLVTSKDICLLLSLV